VTGQLTNKPGLYCALAKQPRRSSADAAGLSFGLRIKFQNNDPGFLEDHAGERARRVDMFLLRDDVSYVFGECEAP
jgi:hypothetical protein